MKVFVYGTLLKGMERESVLAAAEFLGAATITSILFDLDWYPGVYEGGSQVIGELYDIDQTIFVDLDAIEGFDEHCPEQSPYVRKTVEARSLPDGESVNAFCYSFNEAITGELISHGDYRRFLYEQSTHQNHVI